jgi:hypothetical protein
VSPLKQLTIPRLELLAAMIGARLAVSVKKETEQGNPSLFFWSDSSTVIAEPREVVLLGVENSKRIDWPLVVVELIPG